MTTNCYRRGRDDYAAIRDLAADPSQKPARVTEDEFLDMFVCVPPLYVTGVPGFLVGEALTGDERGTVYANYFRTREGGYRARYHLVPHKEG